MKKLIICVLLCMAVPAFAQSVPTVADLEKIDNADIAKEYAKKPLMVKGIVTYTGPDPYGLPSIYLHENADKNGLFIMCVLPFGNFFNLGDVKNGQEITVSGDFRIKHKSDGYLLLKQCSVVDQ